MGVELPSTLQNRLRFTVTVTIALMLMIISSPMVMLVNPTLAKAALPTISTIPSAPSTIGQEVKDGDFTTQAALSSVNARQTNNLVGAQSYYDVIFTTTTTGTIKFIDITFPAGILIGAAPNLAEREGIGAGTAAKTSATQIRYTVTSAVSVPAGTEIRLEFFNIVNPTLSSTGYKITVTTRNAAGTVIDGPTASNGFSMKQISTGQIADGAIMPEAIERVGDSTTAVPGVFSLAEAFCLSGEEAVSGGFELFGEVQELTVTRETKFEGPPEGWEVEVFNIDTVGHNYEAIAICMPAMP